LVLPGTEICATIAPLPWHTPDSRWRSAPAASRAPRNVLPSNGTTRRPPIVLVRSHIHAVIAESSAPPSSRCRHLRIAVSLAPFRVTPSRANTPAGASAAHSPTATNDRAPARVAHNATTSSDATLKRRPRRLRGSTTPANTSTRPVPTALASGALDRRAP